MTSRQLEEHASMMLELEAAELEQEALAEREGVRVADPDEYEPEPAADDLDTLRETGDVDELLRRAKALRTEGDIEGCLAHYRAAAELGSAHAQFSEALFYLSGAVVAEDVSTGLGKLRAAAQAGSIRAKMYLANAYELGVGREPDTDKADVWYRSAVRAANIDVDPDEDEHAFTVAMAELGSIRHARVLLPDESIPKKDRFLFLKNAKALGYALHQRNKQRASLEQEAIAREVEEAMQAPLDEAPAEDAKPKRVKKPEIVPESGPQIGPSNPELGERFTAFVIALGIVGAGVTAGVFGTAAATQMLAEGRAVPVFGVHYGYILPTTVACSLLGVGLVYQWSTILLATVASVVLGAAGWTLWNNPAGALFQDRLVQAHVFGVVGLVVALLVIGLLGGTRRRRWSK